MKIIFLWLRNFPLKKGIFFYNILKKEKKDMNRIKLMVNGIPGNMAVNAAEHALRDDRFELIPWSFTGPEITESEYVIAGLAIRLTRPDTRDQIIADIKKSRRRVCHRGLYASFRGQCKCRILLQTRASFCHGNHRRRPKPSVRNRDRF